MNAMEDRQQQLAAILALAPVIAVVVIDELAYAVPIARALVAGGIRAIEITLRTPCALGAIAQIAANVEHAVVGAGTVLDAAQLEAAHRAGAHFAVSPGSTPRLLDAAAHSSLPLMPGAATASEAMGLLERGYQHLKFFPAVPAGGAKLLAALGGPLSRLRFCPTGGITLDNATGFLALANVACVGGSWLTPGDRLVAGDWQAIEQLAHAAAHLRG